MFAVNSDGEAVEFYGLPPWVPPPEDSPKDSGTSAEPPPPVPNKKSFAARHSLAIALLAMLLLCGGCIAGLTAAGQLRGSTHTTTAHTTPQRTPDDKFVDDLNHYLGSALNRGKDPDIWNQRFYHREFAETGHQVCEYRKTHTYSETLREFKFKIAIGYPTDHDVETFVDLAVSDLCP